MYIWKAYVTTASSKISKSKRFQYCIDYVKIYKLFHGAALFIVFRASSLYECNFNRINELYNTFSYGSQIK